MYSEDEENLRESVRVFAREVLAPKVKHMEQQQEVDPAVLKACFESGIMGVEVPEEYGGVGLGFTASCLAVEEIAYVDASVAVMIDIHNTLNVISIMKYGTPEQRKKYLPLLSQQFVSR